MRRVAAASRAALPVFPWLCPELGGRIQATDPVSLNLPTQPGEDPASVVLPPPSFFHPPYFCDRTIIFITWGWGAKREAGDPRVGT